MKVIYQFICTNWKYNINWSNKIADFVFSLISPLFFLLELYNVLRGIGKPYVKSLDSRSDLPPDPPLWVKLGS